MFSPCQFHISSFHCVERVWRQEEEKGAGGGCKRDNMMQPWPKPTSLFLLGFLSSFSIVSDLSFPHSFSRNVKVVITMNEQFGVISCSIHVHTFTVGLSYLLSSLHNYWNKHTTCSIVKLA